MPRTPHAAQHDFATIWRRDATRPVSYFPDAMCQPLDAAEVDARTGARALLIRRRAPPLPAHGTNTAVILTLPPPPPAVPMPAFHAYATRCRPRRR